MLRFKFRDGYSAPNGFNVKFDFAPYTFDFQGPDYQVPAGHAVLFDFGEPAYVPPPNYLLKCYSAPYVPATKVDNRALVNWEKGSDVGTVIKVTNNSVTKLNNLWLFGLYKKIDRKDIDYGLKYGNVNFPIDSHYKIDSGKPIPTKDVDTKFKTDVLDKLETVTTTGYILPAWKDTISNCKWYSVNKLGSERDTVTYTYPDKPVGNVINFDFATTPLTTHLVFDFSVSQPAPNELTPIKSKTVVLSGRLQPTEVHYSTFAGKAVTEITTTQILRWGYGANNFLIGGVWKEGFKTEPPEPPEPPIIHVDYGVFRIVNIVNVFTYPDNVPLNFESLAISFDVDSFCWSVNFSVSTETDYNLIKPIGGVLREIMVSVNGTQFKFFIGRINRRVSADASSGRVSKSFNCQGWSNLKRLAHPYAGKSSYTDTSETTGAQAVIEIANTYGITVDWQTVDWNIPANVHSYQDQTPLGAILQVVKAVGGVIIPDKLGEAFTVKPRFPVSPWQWLSLQTFPDRLMAESQFFSIDNDTVPKENPDSIYVMGQSVGVKAVRSGKPGNQPLPDIIDKYITTVPVAQERARNEIAANSFIEVIPMETYVDGNGLIEPLDLIEFTDFSGGKWRGLVLSVTISIQRVGTGIVQSITVGRFHDE